MPTPLVVFIPSDKKAALRKCGTLPDESFRDVGAEGWDGGRACVRLWNDFPGYGYSAEPGDPPHPSRLLGLDRPGSSSFANEDLVAKLFGAHVLHIIFLEDEDDGGTSGRGARRDATTGWVGVEPVLEAARWAKAFNESVEYWFSDEQSRDIRHLALVIASGGRVRLSQERLAALREAFSGTGVMRTCYFIDFRLEVETGNDALHSECLWPILAGRLLLRLLIALDGGGSDDVLLPGVHLWRSFEFLFDYPMREMTDMVTKAMGDAYRKLNEETDAAKAAERLAAMHRKPSIRNEQNKAFPGLSKSLGSQEPLKIGDWHSFSADSEAEKCLDDEKRWGGRLLNAKTDFTRQELDIFRDGESSLERYSPDDIFPYIARDPRNVAVLLKQVDGERPTDTISGDGVFREWTKVVAAEKKRNEEKERLRRACDELVLAQAHYVTPPYGMLVAIAVSLLCGFTLFRALLALGGNRALPVAMFFAVLSAVGSFAAWGIVAFIHRRAGKKAVAQFSDQIHNVDECMNSRHGAAVETIIQAETQHKTALKVGAWFASYRLLERVWRILAQELKSPTLSAFYRSVEDDDAEAETPPVEEIETMRQRKIFLERTRFAEKLAAGSFAEDRRPHSDKIVHEAVEEEGEKSFHALWSRICDSADAAHCGNLPAKTIIPEIRRWMIALCDRVSAAQKADLLESRGHANILPTQFTNLRGDAGFILATAHIDKPCIQMNPARVFVFDETHGNREERSRTDVAKHAKNIIQGAVGNLSVSATHILNGLPQVAFYFQDIKLYGFGRADDGRLVFLTKQQADDAAKKEKAREACR